MSGLNLGNLQIFVIDDADLIIKDATIGQMDRLMDCLPKCQKVMFTKNMTNNIERIINNNFNIF